MDVSSMLQSKQLGHILVLFNCFMSIFGLICQFLNKESPSRHISICLESCVSNRNAGSNFYQM